MVVVRRACAVVGLSVAAASVAGAVAGAGTAGTAVSWQPLPQAPIVGRIAASTVWTGKEMIVWGGVTPRAVRKSGPCDRCASDGAAYDPRTRTWRAIARAPAGVRGAGTAAWTGTEMVVWAGNSPAGPVGAAAYNPTTDSWRRLAVGPLAVREGYVSVWTGKELLVIGGSRGDAIATPTGAAVDPRTGVWRRLRAFDAVNGLIPSGAVWNGREAFVSGALHRPAESAAQPIFLSYDPGRDTLRRIGFATAPVPADERGQLRPIGWYGDEVVFTTSSDVLFASTDLVRYDPTTGAWRRAATAPCALPAKAYTQIAWTGNRVVAACGTAGLQIYNLRTDRWSRLKAGPSPLNSCGASAVAWTGTDLIVWSGTVYKPHNPTCAVGASITLGRAPATTITVGSKANGATVRPRAGDTLVVRLLGNPTTGYRWTVAGLPKPLRLVSTAYVPAPPGRLGQGGTYAFRFAVRAGGGALRLEYRRPWERQTPPLRTFTLTIRAR